MKRRFDRSARVADLIQKALAPILQQTLHGFGLITITGVTVSRDLSYAKVYISVLSDEKDKIEEVVQTLNSSTKEIRFDLAKEVKLRIIPELKFVFDEATAHGFHISNLIDSAMNKEKK